LVDVISFRDEQQYLYSELALDVYVEAIQLLPRAAHAGLDLSTRLRELSGSEQLCRAGAMRAMLLGQLPMAVEVYEEGKTVFWSQALRLRSTVLDVLPVADSKKLKHLFQLLNEDSAGISMDGKNKLADQERRIEYRRQLNDQAERLIEEIRGRPGFDRFLRIPQFQHLSQAATNSFVVALVATEFRYFAIVIQANEAPEDVPLPFVNGEMLRKLVVQTSGSGMRDIADRGVVKERIHPRVPLEQLWRTIVRPVLLHLGLEVRDDRHEFLLSPPLTIPTES
jgi:hypothetical protein